MQTKKIRIENGEYLCDVDISVEEWMSILQDESITENGEDVNYNLLDFWRWSVSNIVSNATREKFAEFIVGIAIGLNPKNIEKNGMPVV